MSKRDIILLCYAAWFQSTMGKIAEGIIEMAVRCPSQVSREYSEKWRCKSRNRACKIDWMPLCIEEFVIHFFSWYHPSFYACRFVMKDSFVHYASGLKNTVGFLVHITLFGQLIYVFSIRRIKCVLFITCICMNEPLIQPPVEAWMFR